MAQVPVSALSGVIAIAVGNAHTVALKSDGSVVAWGADTSGQTTVPATALTGVTAITLNATATSNLPITYAVTSEPGVINGATLSFTAKGNVIVTASQSGDNNFNAATDVQRTIVITTH